MPLIVLGEAEKQAAVKGVDSDLRWLLSDNDVDDDIQVVLHHFGIKKMKTFAGIGDDAAQESGEPSEIPKLSDSDSESEL